MNAHSRRHHGLELPLRPPRAHFQFVGTEYRVARHAAMGRAVLDACGWSDSSTAATLFLDYEI